MNTLKPQVYVGIYQGITVGLYNETGKLSSAALEMLTFSTYKDDLPLKGQGVRKALAELGFLKKTWFKGFVLTKKGKQEIANQTNLHSNKI